MNRIERFSEYFEKQLFNYFKINKFLYFNQSELARVQNKNSETISFKKMTDVSLDFSDNFDRF